MKRNTSLIEALEQRIAPAAVFNFTDVDGDLCRITTSKGTAAELASAVITKSSGMGLIVQEIDLSKSSLTFAGANITVSVIKKSATGDGLVNVGYIDAAASNGSGANDGAALNLGVVRVQGDLGQIDAGTGIGNAAASIIVKSMGTQGMVTQGANFEKNSALAGKVGSFVVAGNASEVNIATLDVGMFKVGGAFYLSSFGGVSIGSFKVGAELNGHVTAQKFATFSTGNMPLFSSVTALSSLGKATFGNVGEFVTIKTAAATSIKTLGEMRGVIEVTTLQSLTVGGDLTGIVTAAVANKISVVGDIFGSREDGGRIAISSGLGSLTVKGDIQGGAFKKSAYITVGGSAGKIAINGGLLAYAVAESAEYQFNCDFNGAISVQGSLTSLKIGGNLAGTSITVPVAKYSHAVAGAVIVQGSIGSVFVGGSIVAGTSIAGDKFSSVGAIEAGGNIGALTVRGNITGGVSNIAYIGALGGGSAATDLTPAIGKITIGGDVSDATIRAGDSGNAIANKTKSRDERIGVVKVGGDFLRSTILAGGGAGTDEATISSRIAGIVIGGSAVGGDANNVFGFIAEEIGALRVGTKSYALQSGKLNDVKIALDPAGNTIFAEAKP